MVPGYETVFTHEKSISVSSVLIKTEYIQWRQFLTFKMLLKAFTEAEYVNTH